MIIMLCNYWTLTLLPLFVCLIPICYAINTTELDCQMRRMAVQYAQHVLEPWWNSRRRRPTFGKRHHIHHNDEHPLDQQLRIMHDALRLMEWCGVPYSLKVSWKEPIRMDLLAKKKRRQQLVINSRESVLTPVENWFSESHCNEVAVRCIFVGVPTEVVEQHELKSPNQGSLESPCHSLHQAIDVSRQWKQTQQMQDSSVCWRAKIVLRQGIHSLGRRGTLRLGPDDSGLEIIGFPNEDVWISGAMSIPPPLHATCHDDTTRTTAKHNNVDVHWDKWKHHYNNNHTIWVANLTEALRGNPYHDVPYRLPKVVSLFTTSPHHRLIRARYPNGDPEVAQWGYASPERMTYSIPTRDVVLEWLKPPPGGKPPTFTLVDLRTNHTPSKNNSMQTEYNMYASGHGGVCNDVWGEHADSYWCSNASSGGWAEVDQEAAILGRLQIPVGMQYNTSHPIGQRIRTWSKRQRGGDGSRRPVGVGGIVHAWHSQSWAMHMFEIKSINDQEMKFAKGGGNQGGRNWCRCDQCTYAGNPWCGQYQIPANNSDDRLIGDMWMVENILSELDVPGEFFVDQHSKLLYLMPNVTSSCSCSSPLQIPMYERLLELQGTSNIRIVNVGFRDTAPTYMGEWSAPSGGDWSMHRGGAVFIEDSQEITIEACTFRRLDGNAIFLSRRTRNVTIEGNAFEWLGENAIATWGHTIGYDATSSSQPRHTLIQYNIMREVGIYQKQSSAFGQAKAAQSIVQNNVMFNMPRAAINFNDMMGGGDVVTQNVIFNTCRESGDHGAINTWDRQPFMTTLRDGKNPSFDPLPREISQNLIFANYGASQGVDNDDGSSWYHTAKNVFYSAEGVKMDYGGHDSVFEDNLVMAYPYDGQQCVNFASFFPGHGHIVRRNKCIVGLKPPNRVDSTEFQVRKLARRPTASDRTSDEVVVQLEQCQNDTVLLRDNQYFTPNGSAVFRCYNEDPQEFSLGEFQHRFGLEVGSTFEMIPGEDTLLKWAWSILF